MGTTPGQCANEYDGPITSFTVSPYPGVTLNPLANTGTTFELLESQTYNVTFTIQAPSKNIDGNSLQGNSWYHTDYGRFENGICVPNVSAGQSVRVSYLISDQGGTLLGNQSVDFYTNGPNGNNVTYHVIWLASPTSQFYILPLASNLTVIAHTTASMTVFLKSLDQFKGNVSLTSSSSSTFLVPQLIPPFLSVSQGGISNAALLIQVNQNIPAGNYAITVTGSSSSPTSGTQTERMVLPVSVGGSFALTSSTSSTISTTTSTTSRVSTSSSVSSSSSSSSSSVSPNTPPAITANGSALHAYYNGGLVARNSTSDSQSNSLNLEIRGFIENPLENGDPKYDYYIFSVFAATASNPPGSWWVDSSGLQDSNGVALELNVTTPSRVSLPDGAIVLSNESIIASQVSPSGYKPTKDGEPVINTVTQTISADFCGTIPIININGCVTPSYTSTVSTTFYPTISESSSRLYGTNEVVWDAGPNTMGNPNISSYSYDFLFGMQVPKGQEPQLDISLTGNFGQPHTYGCHFLNLDTCHSESSDVAVLTFDGSFTAPSKFLVASNPGGDGFVQLNGLNVTTPLPIVWNPGTSYTLTASPFVSLGLGERYVFANWTDGGQRSHIIAVPSTPTTFQANFQKQSQLNISSAPGGTTDPPTGSYWYNSSQMATINALPSSGYVLHDWVLDGVDKGNSSQLSFKMDLPHTLTEVFTLAPPMTSSSSTGNANSNPSASESMASTSASSPVSTATTTTSSSGAALAPIASTTTVSVTVNSSSVNSFLTNDLVLIAASVAVLVMVGVAIAYVVRKGK